MQTGVSLCSSVLKGREYLTQRVPLCSTSVADGVNTVLALFKNIQINSPLRVKWLNGFVMALRPGPFYFDSTTLSPGIVL